MQGGHTVTVRARHLSPALQTAHRKTEELMSDMSLAQQRRDAEELQRRETKKAEITRKRTDMKKKSGNQVKENMKTRLEGGTPVQEKHKLSLQRNAVLKVFEACNKNKNGQMDCNELYEAVQFLGAGLSEEEAHVAFASIDTDQNGDIDFEEFFAWYVG